MMLCLVCASSPEVSVCLCQGHLAPRGTIPAASQRLFLLLYQKCCPSFHRVLVTSRFLTCFFRSGHTNLSVLATLVDNSLNQLINGTHCCCFLNLPLRSSWNQVLLCQQFGLIKDESIYPNKPTAVWFWFIEGVPVAGRAFQEGFSTRLLVLEPPNVAICCEALPLQWLTSRTQRQVSCQLV